jgi:hypothetical protein
VADVRAPPLRSRAYRVRRSVSTEYLHDFLVSHSPDNIYADASARAFRVQGHLRGWPEGYHELSRYPNDHGMDWIPGGDINGINHGSLQGVTHDATNWYFSTSRFLFRFPATLDLNDTTEIAPDELELMQSLGIDAASIPLVGYDHFGDLDFVSTTPDGSAGILFVPVTGHGVQAVVAAFEVPSLRFIASEVIPAPGRGSFCAINPTDGLIYVPGAGKTLLSVSFTLSLEHRRLELVASGTHPIEFDREIDFQGAVFSRRGHLYMSSGPSHEGEKLPWQFKVSPHYCGVLAIDLSRGGRVVWHHGIEQKWSEEVEGLTLWDLDDPSAPHVPNMGGQIHVLRTIHDLTSSDDLIVHHWQVQPDSNRQRL